LVKSIPPLKKDTVIMLLAYQKYEIHTAPNLGTFFFIRSSRVWSSSKMHQCKSKQNNPYDIFAFHVDAFCVLHQVAFSSVLVWTAK